MTKTIAQGRKRHGMNGGKPGWNSFADYAESKHPLNCQAWRMKFLRHRCQAKYRGEAYDMTYDDFLTVWFDSGKFTRARRNRNCYQLKRKDATKPWSKSNSQIVRNHWDSILHKGANIHHLKYTVTGYADSDTIKKAT
tara:strand:- start:284 stop:697 length:414 start_codon:yes stop_codon:yes gene_type:complete